MTDATIVVSSFLTTFTYHLPIVHLPTFLEEARIHALIKATKAVGAMYHDTPAATNFINLVLSTIRDEIIAELVSLYLAYSQVRLCADIRASLKR